MRDLTHAHRVATSSNGFAIEGHAPISLQPAKFSPQTAQGPLGQIAAFLEQALLTSKSYPRRLGEQKSLVLAAAIPAAAAEVSRDSYREAVEPVCKVNTEANERIFAGVRAEVKSGKLKPASVQFEKAARALRGTLGQLKPLPRPPADVQRLAHWFAEIEKEISLFKATAAKLRGGNKSAAEKMVVRLTSQAERANAVVVPFQFRYCRLEPSRFT
jgi:hypothetical protein